MTNHSQSLREELLCSVHIPLFTQSRINQIAISINGLVEIAPLSLDLEIGFIDVPEFSCLVMPFDPQLICNQGRKTFFPVSNRLRCEGKAPLEKQLSHISQASFITQSPQNREEGNVSGDLEIVEKGTSPPVRS
jgi:hypothetical protein